MVLVGAVLHFSGLADMSVYDNKMTGFYICSYTAAVLSVGGAEVLARVAGRGIRGYSKSTDHQ